MTFRTRFAPSPTGPLHLGHAYSAILAHDMAMAEGGVFHLRIDDIDQSRARREWETQIYDDLHWLGLTWPDPVWRQSERLEHYRSALQALWDHGLLFPCTCSRADIRAAAAAPHEGAPLHGPDGIVYPGTCRPDTPPRGPMPDTALRLDIARALAVLDTPLYFKETGRCPDGLNGNTTPKDMIQRVGDVALARPGMSASYHLSIVIDDADQNITHVIRGQDLFAATQIHVLLQRLLGSPTPIYHHHHLIRDEAGKRLAKRDDARSLATYRDAGKTPSDIRAMVGL
ncbi:tRNA glutamyl-Q(34) synthetase GluQRS [Roseovarius phycicola]|uniref:tRNA glutamyl-Q(34) synthetase GluQRS n=1 Tax=Roseovarius phycicola TaxID=3080976 RepID=A0ABZ2HFP7_9RHOB